MDPRLNTSLTPQPQNVPQEAARQVANAPAPQPSSQPHSPIQTPPTLPVAAARVPATAANSVEQPMVPQVVAAFPVKQPEAVADQAHSAAPTLAAAPQLDHSAQPEDDLDKILQAVNNRVKAPEKPAESKKKELGNKLSAKAGKFKNKTRGTKPLAPVAVVLIIVLMLSATAIFAYREGNRTATAAKQAGKVGTSYTASSAIQEAGGTLVNPADLDDYAQTLQTKLNALNDNQDFSSSNLSDQVLGL